MGRKKKVKEEEGVGKLKLNEALTALNKKFGTGTITCATTAKEALAIERVPTSVLLIDILLKGGLPKSTINIYFGVEGSGKTLSTLKFASVFTKQKIPVAFIDCEHGLELGWAEKLGNDLEHFYLSQPDTLEKAIDIADTLVRSGGFGLVIFDSLTSAIPIEAVEKSAEKQQRALQARLNTKLMQKLTSGLQTKNLKDKASKNNTIFIGIAQVREKLGILFGNPETIPGGRAIRHHSHHILTFRSAKKLLKNEVIVGREIVITLTKSKYSQPFLTGITEFYFDPPKINNLKTLVITAINKGIIKQVKNTYIYNDMEFVGKEKLILGLQDKTIIAKLKKEVIQ